MRRNGRRIKAWMVLKDFRVVHIARRLKVSRTLVDRTIRGDINNRRVLAELLALKCPARYLALPKDMVEERAQ